MFLLSFYLGYTLVKVLHIVAFFGGFAINIAGLVYAMVNMKKDLPYKHWKDTYPKSDNSILIVSSLVTFKIMRMLDCGFM
jgi:hypothetical protein